MHLETEKKLPMLQSLCHCKNNPSRELSKSFMFYFQNLSWSEGNTGEREKSRDKVLRKTLCSKSFPCIPVWSWQCYSFYCCQAWASTAPGQYKQQWLIWMGKLAGALWQGLLWSHFPWWAWPPSKAAPGELCWAVLVCAIPNHTSPSLFIDCL